jgi:hypothetical protein
MGRSEGVNVSNVEDAEAAEYQLANAWPPDGTSGIVTVKGRTFHRTVDCRGRQQGVREAAKKGRTSHPVEFVTAELARARRKGPCIRCWRDGEPT